MQSRKVVKVFLASPGDLGEERLAARGVVDEFNSTWADTLGYQFDLVGWEDTVSTHGRPQATINRELEQCELFYGIMWKRWGTPPDNEGKFSSGFEEEFQTSLERCRTTGSPSMKMAFKSVDTDLLRDPGAELSKVIDFKNSLIKSREILFETFSDINEFRSRFRRALSLYVQGLSAKEKDDSELEANSSITSSSLTIAVSPSVAIVKDEISFLRYLVSSEKDGRPRLTDADVARLRLVASSLQQDSNDTEALGPHDSNLLYNNRKHLKLSRAERFGLLDAGLSAFANHNVPIWFWLNSLSGLDNDILALSSIHGSAAVRAGAIRAMTLIGASVSTEHFSNRSDLLSGWLTYEDETRAVAIAGLNYLASWGIQEDLELVKKIIDKSDYQTRGPASQAYISILVRDSKQAALEGLISLDVDTIGTKLLSQIFERPSILSAVSLNNALSLKSADIRAAALKALRIKKSYSQAAIDISLSDSDADVRYQAYLLAISAGRVFSDTEARSILVKNGNKTALPFGSNRDQRGETNYEEARRAWLRTLTRDQLDEIIDQTAPLCLDAYIARAERFYSSLEKELKASLKDGFHTCLNNYISAKEKKVGAAHLELLRKLEPGLRSDFTRAALNLVEEMYNGDDIDLVRTLLASGSLEWSESDARYLSRRGEWKDIKLLKKLYADRPFFGLLLIGANKTSGREQVRSLLNLARGRISEFVLDLDIRDITSELILGISKRDLKNLPANAIDKLLGLDQTGIRETFCLRLSQVQTKTALRGIHDRYLRNTPYFYNVIHWLDFALSCPANIVRRGAEKQLE